MPTLKGADRVARNVAPLQKFKYETKVGKNKGVSLSILSLPATGSEKIPVCKISC